MRSFRLLALFVLWPSVCFLNPFPELPRESADVDDMTPGAPAQGGTANATGGSSGTNGMDGPGQGGATTAAGGTQHGAAGSGAVSSSAGASAGGAEAGSQAGYAGFAAGHAGSAGEGGMAGEVTRVRQWWACGAGHAGAGNGAAAQVRGCRSGGAGTPGLAHVVEGYAGETSDGDARGSRGAIVCGLSDVVSITFRAYPPGSVGDAQRRLLSLARLSTRGVGPTS